MCRSMPDSHNMSLCCKQYLAEGLDLVGVGSVPGLPEGQGAQAVLNHLAATPQRLRMHLHHQTNRITTLRRHTLTK